MLLHIKTLKVLHNAIRTMHITPPNCSEVRTMRKIMKGTLVKRKHKFVTTPTMPNVNVFSKGADEGAKSTNVKRAHVLNKLFMRYITELMAMGENASIYTGHGLEVSRVKIAPDFRKVQVFWIAKGTENDELLENVLKENAFSLRHELTQLRVVGQVPEIMFTKDKQQAIIAEVDIRLGKADFGLDYVPTESAVSNLKTKLQLNSKLEPDVLEKIQKLENEDDNFEESLPEMANNVFRINHTDMLNRVLKGMKTAPSSKKLEVGVVNLEYNQNPVEFENKQMQRVAFQSFLRQRAIMQKKLERTERYKQMEEFRSILIEERSTNNQELHPKLFEEDDYILEDDLK